MGLYAKAVLSNPCGGPDFDPKEFLPDVAKKRVIFAFVGEQLIVVSLTGLAADVHLNWTRLDQFISELSLGQLS